MEMLKKFVRWFICFGLSFLVANVACLVTSSEKDD